MISFTNTLHTLHLSRALRATAAAATVALMLASAGTAQAQAFVSGNSGGAVPSTPAKATAQNQNSAWHDAVPEKLFSTSIRKGTLTIDGLTVKVNLDYDLNNVGYMYFLLPGEGTVIVSRSQMPESQEQKKAIKGNTMTISANGHDIVLTSANAIVNGDKKNAETAYVLVDPKGANIARYPMMGYGKTTRAPYQWPGAKAEKNDDEAKVYEHSAVAPPPLPKAVLPKQEIESSYSVKVGPTEDKKGNRIAPVQTPDQAPVSASRQ